MSEQPTLIARSEQPQVEYRDIPGFPGYRVGDDGSVWSCRVTGCWKQLRLRPDKEGRPYLTLWRDGKTNGRRVCRLVLLAFVGPCPPGWEACHFPDRNPANNTLSNLRWDTRAGNIRDKIKHGRSLRGERHPMAKLTEDQVREIKVALRAGVRQVNLQRQFKVSRNAISQIALGITWGWLED